MTKEQAIKNLFEIVELSKDEIKSGNTNIAATLDYEDLKSLQIALEMIEEKDNIINEQLKENVELRKELNEENKRCMILANNDKFKEQVIDLMEEQIKIPEPTMKIESFDIKSKTKFGMRYLNKEEVKQYFELWTFLEEKHQDILDEFLMKIDTN